MRKLAIVIACLLLTGCQSITFSVDGLLGAPNIADEQSAIYEALIESTGRGINLEYPRNGDYRSAFVLYDIDGDGEDETLAFYSVSSVSESNVKIAVLDRSADGDWHSMCELAGAGSSVDRVIFTGLDTVVGFSSQDYEENAVRMYHYASGVLEPVYEDTYTILELTDLDGGSDEIALAKRSGGGVTVSILKAGYDGYDSYVYEIGAAASAISGCVFGETGNGRAMYLDISLEEGGLMTDILTLEDSGIVSHIYQRGLGVTTQRPAGYLSKDYDGDGEIEIPVVGAFTGYATPAWGETEYMTVLMRYSPASDNLEFKSNAYCNLRDGYLLTIPNRWLNVVTVARDAGTGEVTFYKYEPEKPSVTDMTPIISFASADSSGGEAYTAAGYRILMAGELKNYYIRTIAPESEPLVLTADEIRDNFHTIE